MCLFIQAGISLSRGVGAASCCNDASPLVVDAAQLGDNLTGVPVVVLAGLLAASFGVLVAESAVDVAAHPVRAGEAEGEVCNKKLHFCWYRVLFELSERRQAGLNTTLDSFAANLAQDTWSRSSHDIYNILFKCKWSAAVR